MHIASPALLISWLHFFTGKADSSLSILHCRQAIIPHSSFLIPHFKITDFLATCQTPCSYIATHHANCAPRTKRYLHYIADDSTASGRQTATCRYRPPQKSPPEPCLPYPTQKTRPTSLAQPLHPASSQTSTHPPKCPRPRLAAVPSSLSLA